MWFLGLSASSADFFLFSVDLLIEYNTALLIWQFYLRFFKAAKDRGLRIWRNIRYWTNDHVRLSCFLKRQLSGLHFSLFCKLFAFQVPHNTALLSEYMHTVYWLFRELLPFLSSQLVRRESWRLSMGNDLNLQGNWIPTQLWELKTQNSASSPQLSLKGNGFLQRPLHFRGLT